MTARFRLPTGDDGPRPSRKGFVNLSRTRQQMERTKERHDLEGDGRLFSKRQRRARRAAALAKRRPLVTRLVPSRPARESFFRGLFEKFTGKRRSG